MVRPTVVDDILLRLSLSFEIFCTFAFGRSTLCDGYHVILCFLDRVQSNDDYSQRFAHSEIGQLLVNQSAQRLGIELEIESALAESDY